MRPNLDTVFESFFFYDRPFLDVIVVNQLNSRLSFLRLLSFQIHHVYVTFTPHVQSENCNVVPRLQEF